MEWNKKFTGRYPGILDESDGYSDDAATVRVNLANSAQLRVEFHPGDRYWFLKDKIGPELVMANIGPHWALPGLRVEEAIAIGDAMPRNGWTAVLLLLPVVWLTSGDDVAKARQSVDSAWTASNRRRTRSLVRRQPLWSAGFLLCPAARATGV